MKDAIANRRFKVGSDRFKKGDTVRYPAAQIADLEKVGLVSVPVSKPKASSSSDAGKSAAEAASSGA